METEGATGKLDSATTDLKYVLIESCGLIWIYNYTRVKISQLVNKMCSTAYFQLLKSLDQVVIIL